MEAKSSERMVLFSDAVIAITITLLVLDLRLPEMAGEFSDGELWAAIVDMQQRFYAYGLSFVVTAMFWIGHRDKFEAIPRRDGVLTWLNMAFLMSVGLMPFVTGILAENGGGLATALYGGLVAVTSLLLAVIGAYADAKGLSETRPQSPPGWTSFATMAVFGLSVPIALLLDADLAKYFWLLLIPIHAVFARMWPEEKVS